MKLADLRRLSIRKQVRIRFGVGHGLECIVNEHGVAQTPGLTVIPDFNLEQQLAAAAEFVMEPVAVAGRKDTPKPRQLSRSELTSLVESSGGAGAAAPEHDEE